jgi:hypothetical protein
LIRHREPPLGGVAIQGGVRGAVALDCFVAALLAMTWEISQATGTRWARRLCNKSEEFTEYRQRLTRSGRHNMNTTKEATLLPSGYRRNGGIMNVLAIGRRIANAILVETFC